MLAARHHVRCRLAFATLALAALVGCAAVEGLDHYENVDGLSDGITSAPDASGGSSGSGASSGSVTPPGPPGVDAGADATTVDASRSDANEGGTNPPPNPNLAPTGVASATSSTAPAALVNDNNPGTSWVLGPGTCLGKNSGGLPNGCGSDSSPVYVQIAFETAQTIAHLVVLGDQAANPDVLTAELDLLDATGRLLSTSALTMTAGTGDADQVFSPPISGVTTIRLVLLTATADMPALGEIEAFAR